LAILAACKSRAQVALSVEQHLFDIGAGELKLGCFKQLAGIRGVSQT